MDKQTLRYTLPLPVSVNHMYLTLPDGKRKPNPKAVAWMREAQWIIKQEVRKQGWAMRKGVKLAMEIWVYWPDRRKRDSHNLHKLLADAPEGLAYDDDRYVLLRDIDFAVDRKKPRVEIEISEVRSA